MKYLRKFNEDVSDEFRQLCEESLINLTDNDFEITYQDGKIKIQKWDNYGYIDWEQIKDVIIPFLDILRERFDDVNIIAKIVRGKIKYGDETEWIGLNDFTGVFTFLDNRLQKGFWKNFNDNIEVFDKFISGPNYTIWNDFYIVYK